MRTVSHTFILLVAYVSLISYVQASHERGLLASKTVDACEWRDNKCALNALTALPFSSTDEKAR